MTFLLDHYTPVKKGFRPRSPSEMFALRLAQKLGDDKAFLHYVNLISEYSESQLLCAYRRALRASTNGDIARRFHAELGRGNAPSSHDPQQSLISVRIERRTIAAAIFEGCHLEYTDSRQLSSAPDKALASAIGFLIWLLDQFPVQSAALEAIPAGQEFQRRVLHDALCAILRDKLLPIWEVPRVVLLETCASPPLKSRALLREIAATIWPILAGTHAKLFIQDAAMLGLHAQTERRFIIND